MTRRFRQTGSAAAALLFSNASAVPILTAAILLGLTACERRAPEVQVRDAWARPAEAGDVTAAYMTLRNTGAVGDTLKAARTAVARAAEIHRSSAGSDGVMQMRPVDDVFIPPGSSVAFEPGGYHVMLIDLQRPLVEGEDGMLPEAVVELASA